VDLDWFWRSWFYSTDHVDQAITGLTHWTVTSGDPNIEKDLKRKKRDADRESLTRKRHAQSPKRSDRFPRLLDFYNEFDKLDVTPKDERKYKALLKKLSEEDRGLLALPLNFYELELEDLGGVPMPVHLAIHYNDGSTSQVNLPAQVWQENSRRITKLLVTEGTIQSIELDPMSEIADADEANDHWPRRIEEGRIQLRDTDKGDGNPMRTARDEAKRKDKQAQEEEDNQQSDEDAEDKD
jgi:hypothetical protein